MVKCDRDNGVSGRKALECMTWIGTSVLWTVSGGVPHSFGIMGESAAAEANGLTFLQISDKSLGSVEVHQVWSLSSAQPLAARIAVRTATLQEFALRGTMTNNVHAKHARTFQCDAALPYLHDSSRWRIISLPNVAGDGVLSAAGIATVQQLSWPTFALQQLGSQSTIYSTSARECALAAENRSDALRSAD